MDIVVNTYNLFLDSKYRTKTSENYHPVFELQSQITLSNPNNYFEIELMSADVPFSFYMVDIPNNVVKVSINNGLTSFLGEISIPAGNYNINTLAQALSDSLKAKTIAETGVANPPTLAYSYDVEDSKITFTLANGIVGQTWIFAIYWDDGIDSYDIFAQLFGFSFTSATLLTLTGLVPTYLDNVSPYVVCVNPISSLYLRSDTLNQALENQEILVDTLSSTSNILGKVEVNGVSMTWLFYETYDFKVRLRNTEIKQFDLFWSGLTYDEIRFRGVFWRVQLRIKEMQPYSVFKLLENQQTASKQVEEEALQLMIAKRKLADDAAASVSKMRRRAESNLPLD